MSRGAQKAWIVIWLKKCKIVEFIIDNGGETESWKMIIASEL